MVLMSTLRPVVQCATSTWTISKLPLRSMTTKVLEIQKKALVIPKNDLHPHLKPIADHIRRQSYIRVIGSGFYPLMTYLDLPFAILWTPVCVGTHQVSIKYAYKAAKASLLMGNIAADRSLNTEAWSKVKDRQFVRFHINYKGDLVLHAPLPLLSPERFKGASLSHNPQIKPSFSKINFVKNKLFASTESQISFFHLEENVRNKVENVLSARKLRFRACIGIALLSSLYGKSYNFLNNGCIHPAFYSLMGLGFMGSNFPHFKVAQRTHELGELLRTKQNLVDIIQPQYRSLYPHLNPETTHYHVYVTTLGNIHFSQQKPFTLRKKERVEYSK